MSDKKIVKFALITPNAVYGAGTYTDPDTGEYMYVTTTQNKQGNPVPYRFIFTQGGGRILSIPEVWKDVEGKSMVEFLRNHPECEGSPKNRGQRVYFKEINDEKDAELDLSIQTKVLHAKNAAVALKGDKLKYIALLLGDTSASESKRYVTVLNYAENNPDEFLRLVESPDVEIRALIREAVTKGVITKKGTLHIWETVNLGGDEDAAVARLTKEKDLLDAIKRALLLKK